MRDHVVGVGSNIEPSELKDMCLVSPAGLLGPVLGADPEGPGTGDALNGDIPLLSECCCSRRKLAPGISLPCCRWELTPSSGSWSQRSAPPGEIIDVKEKEEDIIGHAEGGEPLLHLGAGQPVGYSRGI